MAHVCQNGARRSVGATYYGAELFYSQSIRFHPATPEGKLFLRLRAGAGDATGRSILQRSSYIAYESRGVCDVATRANGFDGAEEIGELD